MQTYFQFKQFIVHQEDSAMKVCTDACLFGAWVSEIMRDAEPAIMNMLDIGTGTGLLSLMVAQQIPAEIDAVEIEPAAAAQATRNVLASPWKASIHVLTADILHFKPTTRYDLVISNPPFFDNDLKPEHHGRSLAKHESALALETLFVLVDHWLVPGGWFALLLPSDREASAVQTGISSGMHLRYKALVRQTEKHTPFRVMLIFSDSAGDLDEEEIIIKEQGQYSARFAHLLRPFYLYL